MTDVTRSGRVAQRTLPEAVRYLADKAEAGVLDPGVLAAVLRELAAELEKEENMFAAVLTDKLRRRRDEAAPEAW